MRFYKSTAGCNHYQYAIVTPVKKNKEGNDYLCIWTNETEIHKEGHIIENLEDIYLEEVDIDVNNYPLSKTFLFKIVKDNFKFSK